MRACGLLLLLAVACKDPMRQRSLAELGGEAAGVPAGPLHRPGQPCLICHGEDGPANARFVLAGTVYQHRTGPAPLHDARIRFIDSTGVQYAVSSNCAGNFWVSAPNYRPAWPVWMKVEYGASFIEMQSPTFREGSCAACHESPASPSSAGQLYFADDSTPFTQASCR
jgi:cytochrome c553